MGGRKSLSSVDEAKLQLAREETEALQIKVQSLQDELDGAREEQKFEETRSAKLEAQVRCACIHVYFILIADMYTYTLNVF